MRTKTDLEKATALQLDASQATESLENQKKALKDELRELKLREQRLLNDYTELEEENITLQKQVRMC